MRARIAICGRNDERWPDADYDLLRIAKPEALKPMSHTRPEHVLQAMEQLPGVHVTTRLYDPRLNSGGHPSAVEFCNWAIPVISERLPFCKRFQVANEPNHVSRIEGFGPTDADAIAFDKWFLKVYRDLKGAFPEATFGFPGLAIPDDLHRDRAWLYLCRQGIEAADWLGCHCYWQSPPGRDSGIFHPAFGLNYLYYHDQFPHKRLDILECGNSNGQNGYPLSEEVLAEEYVTWLERLWQVDYVEAASFFILSSPDKAWQWFTWREEGGRIKTVAVRIGSMTRPPLHDGEWEVQDGTYTVSLYTEAGKLTKVLFERVA